MIIFSSSVYLLLTFTESSLTFDPTLKASSREITYLAPPGAMPCAFRTDITFSRLWASPVVPYRPFGKFIYLTGTRFENKPDTSNLIDILILVTSP